MQKTRVLSSLRDLFPPIHQPLPLDKRESQRLLESLKKSFREELDRQHGWVSRPVSDPLPLPNLPLNYLPSNDSRPSSARASTDQHLHAILDNPHFSPAERAQATDGSANVWDRHKNVFSLAVSRGLMTLPRAHGFLLHIQAEVGHAPALSILEGLKPTGAGLLVLRWLQSSGMERDLSFLSHGSFAHILVRFLVAEGREDIVWSWIERLMRKEGALDRKIPVDLGSSALLASLVSTKAHDVELEGGYTAVLKGAAMLREQGLPPIRLKGAWRTVSYQSTTKAWKHSKPPAELFERFCSLGPTLPASPLDMAHLNLCHPVNPSPRLAVEFLSSKSAWQGLDPAAPSFKQKIYLQRIYSLGLDALQHLMKLDEVREASRLWDILKTRLGGGGGHTLNSLSPA